MKRICNYCRKSCWLEEKLFECDLCNKKNEENNTVIPNTSLLYCKKCINLCQKCNVRKCEKCDGKWTLSGISDIILCYNCICIEESEFKLEKVDENTLNTVKCKSCKTLITSENAIPCEYCYEMDLSSESDNDDKEEDSIFKPPLYCKKCSIKCYICKNKGCRSCIEFVCEDCKYYLCKDCKDHDHILCGCYCIRCSAGNSEYKELHCRKCKRLYCNDCEKDWNPENCCYDSESEEEIVEKNKLIILECESCKIDITLENAISCEKCEVKGCDKCVITACYDCIINMYNECRNNDDIKCDCHGKCYTCEKDISRDISGWPCGDCGIWNCEDCKRIDSKCINCGLESSF